MDIYWYSSIIYAHGMDRKPKGNNYLLSTVIERRVYNQPLLIVNHQTKLRHQNSYLLVQPQTTSSKGISKPRVNSHILEEIIDAWILITDHFVSIWNQNLNYVEDVLPLPVDSSFPWI